MSLLWGVEMEGKTVLDIGGYDGRASKVALEAGAKSATVLDNREWEKYGWAPPGRAHEDIAFTTGDFHEEGEPADVVICFNVIYHCKEPLKALKRLRKLAKDTLLIKTSFVTEDEVSKDGWLYYPDGTGHPNGTVWARPSPEGFEKALKAAGFKKVERVQEGTPNDEGIWRCE